MSKADWQENSLDRILGDLYPHGLVSTILDVGCGISLKSQYLEADFRLGLDIHRPMFEKIATTVPYGVVQLDARNLRRNFVARSWDLVLLCDILEHLERHEGERLLDEAEAIARVAVIIESPQGWIPQNIDIWGLGADVWQTHRSSWEPKDLEERGYAVVTRPYRMSEAKRHTHENPPLDITMMAGIKRLGGQGPKGEE